MEHRSWDSIAPMKDFQSGSSRIAFVTCINQLLYVVPQGQLVGSIEPLSSASS
jgi:hypothetical protein